MDGGCVTARANGLWKQMRILVKVKNQIQLKAKIGFHWMSLNLEMTLSYLRKILIANGVGAIALSDCQIQFCAHVYSLKSQLNHNHMIDMIDFAGIVDRMEKVIRIAILDTWHLEPVPIASCNVIVITSLSHQSIGGKVSIEQHFKHVYQLHTIFWVWDFNQQSICK